MKQYFGAILRFFKAVFFTFGLLIFLFCVRRYLPGFNGSQGVGLVELRLCLAMAVVFFYGTHYNHLGSCAYPD